MPKAPYCVPLSLVIRGMGLVAFLLAFLSLPLFAHAAAPTKRQLYLEWRHTTQTITLGHISGKHFQRIAERNIPLADLTPADVAAWLAPADSSAALLYFHCMWGQERHFHRQILRALENALANQANTGIQTVISVLWHAGGTQYVRNWNRAADKGEAIGPLLGWISAHYAGRLHALAHSMGNRFLAGALRTTGEASPLALQSLVLFSPDLNAAAADVDLEILAQASDQLIVFIHRRDRVLLSSSWMLGRQRLGRSGPVGDLPTTWSQKLLVIDMTGRVRGVQNHTHLRKKWVQRRLAELWRD